MTAKKQSLLDKGVILNVSRIAAIVSWTPADSGEASANCQVCVQDYTETQMLLSSENVNQDALQCYAREAADFGTKYQLPTLDYAMNHCGQPDVAMFDFTSMHASENAALVRERFGHQLLVALVGDSLLEVGEELSTVSQCCELLWSNSNVSFMFISPCRANVFLFQPQPFWPMGTGCARGFLAAFDTAWMVNSWAQGQTALDVLAERYCNWELCVYIL